MYWRKSMDITDEVVSLIEDLDMEFEDSVFSGKNHSCPPSS